MTIQKTEKVDRIEVLENNIIQVREVIFYTDNGEEVSKQFNRYTLSPGDDVADQPQRVRDVANAVWVAETD